MQKIAISICIVAYKADDQLKKCLSAIYSSKFTSNHEIIVVDNNEEDSRVLEIIKKYPKVRSIKARRNGGYGAGNNLAISNSTGEYVLVINPDVIVQKNTIQKLHDFIKKHKKVAAVGTAYQITNGMQIPLGTGELTPLRAIFSLSFLNKLFPNNLFSKKYYLSNEIRRKPTQVWAVAGSIALFRKKALIEAGSYDEKLFLYYEESDLGRRLKQKGWELWIINHTTVFHSVGKSTKNIESNKITKIFIESRKYYFRKHFGFIKSLIVEAFARFGKFEALIIIILGIGTFLRFFKLQENMVFHGELGDNYLAMKNIFTTGVIPLLGPPTSHPWLSFGPLYYWLFAPVLLFSRYSPVGVAYIFAFLHSTLIVVNYWFIKKNLNKKVAIISSFIIAISPAYLSFAHESRFFSLTLIIFYPLFYFLIEKKYFFSGLAFAILLNFHLTPAVYIPAILLLFYRDRKFLKTSLISFFKGAVLASVPFVLYNALSRFEMLKNVFLWIPYRIGGFIGLVPKNNLSTSVLEANVGSGLQFLKYAFMPLNTPHILSLIVIFTIIIITARGIIYEYLMQKRTVVLLCNLLVFGYISIFIHGEPPTHYYLPLYPVLIILASVGFSKIKSNLILLIFSIMFVFYNFSFYFSSNWFNQNQRSVSITAPVPYQLQLNAVSAIISSAQGRKYSLIRVGPYDQFERYYSQNYIYLLSKNGAEPVLNSPIVYTIYENMPVKPYEQIIFSEGGLTVTIKYEVEPIIT